MPDAFIPFARPSVTAAEIDGVERVIRSGWWTTGPETKAFEEEFADYIGAPYAVAVNSCTAGLHIALDALGVDQGDLVLVPTMTFAASAEVALYQRAFPLLLDVDSETSCLDPAQVEALLDVMTSETADAALGSAGLAPGTERMLRSMLDRRVAAAIPVHYGGQACDMDRLLRATERSGVAVVEDAAHAVETFYGDRKVGTLGVAAAFSFYATKNLSTGEGGMVTTADGELAERMRRLTLHGISRDAWKRYTAEGSWYYEVVERGYKYNLTDIAAALGRAQLQRIAAMASRRQAIAAKYSERLGSLPEVQVPVSANRGVDAWHLYVLRLVPERLTIDREAFIQALHAAGVGTSVHFIPLHLHPLYRSMGYRPGDMPVAESLYERIVSLPIYPDLSDDEVERVCAAVERVCTENAV